jgi:lipopolysaccharide export system ATP-binding protein
VRRQLIRVSDQGEFLRSSIKRVLSILKPLRRKTAPRAMVPSELWRIDLGPVAEPMINGHTERMNFVVTERIALGKSGKRVTAQPIGRATERDFDWKSVQLPERWRDETDGKDRRVNGNGFSPSTGPRATESKRPAHPLERVFGREAQREAALESLRESPHALAAVVAEAGALTVQGVEKSFAGRKVVRGVSLSLRRGEAVGLLGPNGAGKTTVFYMITGLIKADKGRIQFDGHEITHLPMYQRARLGIGYLPQEASIFRGLNVEDNIRAVLEVVEPNKKKREEELDKLLDEFNITSLRKTPSIALSGGERRRTEIARALATRPAYMLLDEPFAGIDPIAVGDIQQLVRHLTERGIGVLITDHNVRETLGLTDRAYIIYSGEVLREGRADDIINDPEVRRLYLGEQFRM